MRDFCRGTTSLPVLDAALARELRPDAILAELDRHRGLPGIRQARELVPLADPRPESPQESRLRLHCHDAGLPPPTLQLPVAGRHIDLGWKEQRVGLEYDGEEAHTGRRRMRADRRRHNTLQADDWLTLYAVDRDIFRDHAELMRKVGAALVCRSRAEGRQSISAGDRSALVKERPASATPRTCSPGRGR